ncbi:MAG: fibronectin type III domain-containing protein, partial [Myxococcota bacterium]|nr:fibronectin type III domain-containing protein [Myxococcota bacterium]
MTLRCTTLSILVALGGCDEPPRTAKVGGDSGVAVERECDPRVLVPVGVLHDRPIPAAAHADVYGSAPDPFSVHLGLPSRDPSTSISMLWRTDAETMASIVEYGPAETWPEGAVRVEGYTYGYGGTELGTGPYRMHEVRLCEVLIPGTAYTYRVGGEGAWSDVHTFTTPGAPGSFDTYRIAVAGDSRGAYDTWAQVVAAMEVHEPDLFLFSGDMVELGAVQPEWDAWFAAAGDAFARKPIVPAHGNHEFL